jgi:hypothetical protein
LEATPHPLRQQTQQAFRACDNAIMKFSAISLGLLALLTPLTAAWSKEGMFPCLSMHLAPKLQSVQMLTRDFS